MTEPGWRYTVTASQTGRLRDGTVVAQATASTLGDAVIRATTIALGIRQRGWALVRVHRVYWAAGRRSRQVQYSAKLMLDGSRA